MSYQEIKSNDYEVKIIEGENFYFFLIFLTNRYVKLNNGDLRKS